MPYSVKQFMVCISGYSGSGKDEFAKVFVDEELAPKVGLADPAKRHMADLYGFDEQQLFGPSAFRNAGDVRYPKKEMYQSGLTISDFRVTNFRIGLANPQIIQGKKDVPYWEYEGRTERARGKYPYIQLNDPERAKIFVPEGDPHFWLSPRESLQRYCELMNTMYGDSWIMKAVSTHMQLGQTVEIQGHRFMKYIYDRMRGLVVPNEADLFPAPESNGSLFTCSADFRHKHEFRLVRKMASSWFMPVTIRVKRPSVPVPPFDHRSETEQATIPDSFFDFVVDNDGTVEDLHMRARDIISVVQTPGWQPLRGSL